MQNEIICPTCRGKVYLSLDCFGYTPWHLHCDNCDINIGANNAKKVIELFQKYNKPHMTLEYYFGEIKMLYEEGKMKIYKENQNVNNKLEE